MPKTTAKAVKILHVNLRQSEVDVLEHIKEAGDSVPEIIRSLIREYGEKKFKGEKLYAQVEKEKLELRKRIVDIKSMTPAEIAIKKYGLKVKDNKFYSLGYTKILETPLEVVKELEPGIGLLARHEQVLNAINTGKEIMGNNGQIEMNKEQIQIRKEQWEAL